MRTGNRTMEPAAAPATDTVADAGAHTAAGVTDSASISECAQMLALFDGLQLKDKYKDHILKYKLTQQRFEFLAQNHWRLSAAAPFLKENYDDLIAVAGSLEHFRDTGEFVQNRAEWLRRLPYKTFLDFLASFGSGLEDKYVEGVVQAKIDTVASHSIFDEKLRTFEEEKKHLLSVAPFLSEEDADCNCLVTQILKQKRQKAEEKCSSILALLDRLGMKEKYFAEILEKPFSNLTFGWVCEQIPNSEHESLEMFKNGGADGGDYKAVFNAFNEIRLNKAAWWEKESALIKYACFLNILDHLGLREKYQKAVLENNVTNEKLKEWIHQSDQEPVLPKFITAYGDRNKLLKLLRLLKKSEGTNLLPHIPPEELQMAEEDLLGKGSFGHVSKCLLARSHLAALKTFLPGAPGANTQDCIQLAQAELTTISKLSHQNIVNVWGYVQVEETEPPRLLLEYVENGNLTQHLHKWYDHWRANKAVNEFMVAQLVRVSVDIVRGMAYLHSQNCLHRDLKPDNILMNNNDSAKVGDFGISKFLNPNPDSDAGAEVEDGIEQQHYYSFYFSAKEVLPPNGTASKGSDVWSFGVVLQQIWCLAAEKPYGNGTLVEEVKKYIRAGLNPYDSNPDVTVSCCPPGIRTLFAQIFRPKALKSGSRQARPSFDEILEHLNKEFQLPDLPEETFDIRRGIDFSRKLAQLQNEQNPQHRRGLQLSHEYFEMSRNELREFVEN